MSEPGGTGAGPEEADRPATAASDDSKARFREALEKKKAASHRSSAGATGTSSVHGPEVTGASRRVFRRKSG